jgi:hypothetical protein
MLCYAMEAAAAEAVRTAAAEGLTLERSDNTARFKGVYCEKHRFRAQLGGQGSDKRTSLGTFATVEEAALAYARARAAADLEDAQENDDGDDGAGDADDDDARSRDSEGPARGTKAARLAESSPAGSSGAPIEEPVTRPPPSLCVRHQHGFPSPQVARPARRSVARKASRRRALRPPRALAPSLKARCWDGGRAARASSPLASVWRASGVACCCASALLEQLRSPIEC